METVATSLADGAVSPTADTEAMGDREPIALLAEGDHIGRYVVQRRLGQGGMGVVYAVHDPELARDIAVKVLRDANTSLELRLQREARALARVSHDNVVRVFDVGVHAGQVFLAMELVDGVTLAEWLTQAPRAWSEVVDVYRAAGRGLAEAHAAGIVHRDFKPGNVMIDRNGRVVVTDFGLARAAGELDLAAAYTPPDPDMRLTREGALIGTPRYMAPEQLSREAATALSDQFSFAVSLFEGIAGKHPFTTSSTDELLAQIRAHRFEEARMPSWLRRVLARAMAYAPQDRYPNMTAVLAALGRGRRRPMKVAITAGVVAAVALTAGATFALGARPQAASCEHAADRVGSVWNATQRARVAQQLTKIRPTFGAQTATRVIEKLDQYASELATERLGACQATVEDKPVAHLSDPQCLDEQLRSLTKVAHAFADAPTPELVDHADAALAGLADCERRGNTVIAPPPAQIKPTVDRMRDTLADADLVAARGDYATALTMVRPVVATARALGYGPLLGEALTRAGKLGHAVQDPHTDADLREAAEVAGAAHDDRTAMRAFTALLEAAGSQPDHPDRFDALLVAARAAAARTDDAGDRASIDLIYGEAMVAADKTAEGEASCQHALDAFTKLDGPQSIHARQSLRCLGDARTERGDFAGARKALEQSLELDRSTLGDDHPETADDEQQLGELQLRTGQFDEGLKTVEHAREIRGRVFGERSDAVAKTEHLIGNLLLDNGHPDQALTHLQTGLSIASANHGADSIQAAAAYASLGSTYSDLGKPAESRPLFEHAIAIYERNDQQSGLGIVLINLSDLLIDQRDWDAGLATSQHALKALEAGMGASSPIVALGLLDTSRCLIAKNRAAEAVPLLERAITISDPQGDPYSLATIQLTMGRALFASGGDAKRARALLHEAIKTFDKIGDTAGSATARAQAVELLKTHP